MWPLKQSSTTGDSGGITLNEGFVRGRPAEFNKTYFNLNEIKKTFLIQIKSTILGGKFFFNISSGKLKRKTTEIDNARLFFK